MGRIKKKSVRAKKSCNRVRFHRDVNKILQSPSTSNQNKYENISSEEEKNKKSHPDICFQEKLRRWSLKYNISKRAINELLIILISFGMHWLPKDSRTLLSTPRSIDMINLSNGKIWYNGIQKNLQMIFVNLNADININLCFNFDGLPLFNSSKWQFWPILASIYGNYYATEYY